MGENPVVTRLRKSVEHQQKCIDQVKIALELVDEMAICIGDIKSPQHEKLEKSVRGLSEIEFKFRDRASVLKKIADKLAQDEKAYPEDVDWQQEFKTLLNEEAKTQEEAQTDRIKAKVFALKRKAWEAQHPGEPLPGDGNEEEFIIVPGNALICPLTQVALVDPVKNSTCEHTFSKAAIIEFIQKKRGRSRAGAKIRVDCPVAGCGKPIAENTLERDVQAERQLLRNQRNIRTQKRRRGGKAPAADLDLTQFPQ